MQPMPAPKRELDLSPAAMRGLALIRENTLQDESSKVGGGGSIKPMNVAFPMTMYPTASISCLPMQQQQQQQAVGGGVNQMGLKSQGSHSQLRTPTSSFSLSKSTSLSSLSGSYHAGAASGVGVGSIASSPIMSTPTPIVTSSPSPAPGPLIMSPSGSSTGLGVLSSSFSSHQLLHHHHHPIAAMAAGAAAAAAAVVNHVSSAISEHIHPPSIYAAQPNSSALSSPWKGSLEGQQIQQQQEHLLQQPFYLPSFSASLPLEQHGEDGEEGHTSQPLQPSPTIDQDGDLTPATGGTLTPTLTSAPNSNSSGISTSSGSPLSETVTGVVGVQAALSTTVAASALSGATAKAVAASNATMAATGALQMNSWV
jgi:hypothetical protein